MESEGCSSEPKLIDFFKLEKMPIRDLDQNVEAGSKQAASRLFRPHPDYSGRIQTIQAASRLFPSMESQESQESGVTNAIEPPVRLLLPLTFTPGAHSVQLRSGGCDSSRHIVGAGAVSTGVSRASPSRSCRDVKHLQTKPTEAAGQAADSPKFNFLGTPSLTNSTTTELGSVTSVDSDPQAREDTTFPRHSNISAGTSQSTDQYSPLGPQEFELKYAFSHGDMQLHKKPRFNAVVESGSCRWSGADVKKERLKMIGMKTLELENVEQVGTRQVASSTRSSQHNSDPAGETRMRIWQADEGAIPELEKDSIVQAATALVMLSLSNESICQSSSSLAGVCLRPISSSKTAGRLARGINAGQEIISFQGGEAARPSNSEEATVRSALFRPSNKRRYRLILDLLAETPRISGYSENFN